MSRISHSILAALVLAVLLATIGCGGGDSNESLTPTKDVASGYGFELITEQIASLDSSLAENSLSMELKELKGNAVKAIITANGKSITGAAFAVEYDMNALTPIRVETGDFLGADLMELSLLDMPGEVPVAMTQMAPFTAPSTGSGVVAEIYFEKEANRTVSGTPGGLPPAAPINDLVASYNVGSGEVTLTCTSPLAGDVNGDGRVSGPDVLYVGAHLGEPITGVTPYSAADCIDSDEDGFVSTGDIINIGIHYREEEDGIEFYKSISDTNLGPYTFLGSVDRPEGDGSDPAWDYCQPVYGMDTIEMIDVPDHFPYYYKAAAYYTDSDSGLTSFGPDSNFATGDNVVYVEVDSTNHSYGNNDDIILSFNVGALESTDNMTIHVEFDPIALDMDPASWVMGDFFSPAQSSTIFYTPGTGFFDLAISDINNASSGNGWLGDLTFEILIDDYQSNFMIGIDPAQGSFYEDALGNQTQFAAVGDTWAKWGDGHRPALGTPQCYRFFDSISEGDGTGNWEFWSAADDQAEDTLWHFTDWTHCSGPNSMWFGEMGSDPPIYGDRAHDYVDSIAIDLSDFSDPEGPIPSLMFKYWHNFENIIPPVDFAKLWISSYPYSTWDEIEVFSGDSVPDGIGDDPENPNPCPDWTSFSYSLENYLGQNIKLRFEGKSDFSNPQPFQGMAIDDVKVGFTSGGGGGVKKVRLLCIQDYNSDSYGGWTGQMAAFEELGLTESDEAADDTYVVFNNYSSTYETYFMDEDLLADFNAIYVYCRGSYYGTLFGSQDERDMLQEWLEYQEGRVFVLNTYFYAPRVFSYSTSYPNYDPTWAWDFLGMDNVGSNRRYAYNSAGTGFWATVEGEMYEELDDAPLYGYTGSPTGSVYADSWPLDEATTTVLGYLGAWTAYGNTGFPGWTPPSYNCWLKDDTGSTVVVDEFEPQQLMEDDRILRSRLWLEETGFVLPDMGESWDPESGECIVDDVLPAPSSGPGFGWGGGVAEEGGGGPTEKHASVLIIDDQSSDSYNQIGLIADSLEELDFEEDTSGNIGDDLYYVFNNYSGTYASYYISEDLLANANVIIWEPGTQYYGTLMGNSTERQIVQDWLESVDGAMIALNAYYWAPYYMCSYSGAGNYCPDFMDDVFGITSGQSSASGYASGIFYGIGISGTLYEPMGTYPLHYYSSTSGYNYMPTVGYNTGNGTAPVAYYEAGGQYCAWAREDTDYDFWAIYDLQLPSQFSGAQVEYLNTRTLTWLEGTGFALP